MTSEGAEMARKEETRRTAGRKLRASMQQSNSPSRSLSRAVSSRPVLRRACSALGTCVAHTRSQLHSQPERRAASELALFYRKGLIALPITDNATINDLEEDKQGGGERERGKEMGRGVDVLRAKGLSTRKKERVVLSHSLTSSVILGHGLYAQ